ncbi:bacterial regulatory s, tetR family protein [Mycolicibacterium hassiacum DSM 44199]|uniref:Bacterial regulatory s, tetR family protein n=1 Tax=Mycolicibacterium hassiacum (strain DSM 44199 / CIP 105218 / JCM 12690 / 3849) TaxID=1122247 RepID=K5BG36_MYCHD|nr:TetR/AcrR family transcriptional regulator [Mycolicibacterium hassiacum]EKF24432.1 bacterial regulatory s, tetR family protein [Mycolicibacterium hassiacum DSM 44199]MBX5486075.1 TetR/AcrR family transcriptional regulator [Mycolicibacterium hassiacum]MDA4084993.1 TetR family transcriptional regulator [Mycolicibacterium hassiacum DSM 44199]PZN23136.1 MAG: TetR family transcriptional regulator [Mycolicibacterium hassiacum]VCT89092.1 HTH-type transcriptional regulator BetI [Mycolicibacterium h
MARPADLQRRRELLDAVVDECARGGIGDRSLREVAAAVGTSHRMLLHHFGSRDGLLLAVVEEVERRQLALLHELPEDPADAVAAMWANLRRPELRPAERLFFECYARGVQGEQPFARLPRASVRWWLQADTGRTMDPALMRLGLAVARGLLLDLVATDDLAGVDAAVERFIELLRRAYQS